MGGGKVLYTHLGEGRKAEKEGLITITIRDTLAGSNQNGTSLSHTLLYCCCIILKCFSPATAD